MKHTTVIPKIVLICLIIGSIGATTAISNGSQSGETTEPVTVIRSGGDQSAQLNQSNNRTFWTAPPTKNVSRELIVRISELKNATTKFEVKIAYPARSEGEADAAENGSFNPEWFDGTRRINRTLDRLSEEGAFLRSSSSGSYVVSERFLADGPVEPEHGWVVLYTDAWCANLTAADEDVVIGPAYHRSLANSSTGSEWTLKVTVHKSWEPSVMNGDPIVRPDAKVLDAYIWENVTSQTGTLLEFDSPITETTTDASGPLGVGGGAILTGLAVILAVILANRSTKRRP